MDTSDLRVCALLGLAGLNQRCASSAANYDSKTSLDYKHDGSSPRTTHIHPQTKTNQKPNQHQTKTKS